jgi:Gpi18-like mannosyltransferase
MVGHLKPFVRPCIIHAIMIFNWDAAIANVLIWITAALIPILAGPTCQFIKNSRRITRIIFVGAPMICVAVVLSSATYSIEKNGTHCLKLGWWITGSLFDRYSINFQCMYLYWGSSGWKVGDGFRTITLYVFAAAIVTMVTTVSCEGLLRVIERYVLQRKGGSSSNSV